MSDRMSTPREDGFSMPAEWESHDACLMEWPTVTRRDFWADRFDEATHDYAAVATAIGAFEPVVMVCDPDQEAQARRLCGENVEILPLPIDDSWMRDNGPIFVRDGSGRVALVHFRFNSWGEVPPVRQGRGCATPHRRSPGDAALRGAIRARGWVVLRGW